MTAGLLCLVKSGLDLQTAVAMFRACAGPASQYTLASCEVCAESASTYDTTIAACFSQFIDRPVLAEEPRLWLPLRMGGCGLSSALSRVNSAPWAAWTAAIDSLVLHMGCTDVEELLSHAPVRAERLAGLHGRLIAQGAPACISYVCPVRALSLGATQKYLVSHLQNQSLQQLRAGFDNDAAAFLRSASGPAAGSFLEVPLDDR